MRKIIETYSSREIYPLIFKSLLIVIPLSVATGLGIAGFLWMLDKVTILQHRHSWLLFLLPLAGIFIWWIYYQFGERSASGNKLIIEEIHTPGGGVPVAMAPLVTIGTIITHLFGGSAGREGTAVQMAGSFGGFVCNTCKLKPGTTRIVLIAAISAGFAAVFGTPLTGSIFSLEVLKKGSTSYDALIPALVAAFIAHGVCIAAGIHHTEYGIRPLDHLFEMSILLKTALAGIAFGLAAFLFIQADHGVRKLSARFITVEWLRPVGGALIIILLCITLGTRDYTGLGVSPSAEGGASIVSAFSPTGVGYFSWFWKIVFTAITLGTGFKGGEVTPLFFIGATLGNTLASVGGMPIDLFAGLGFIAVFAGASKTPLACTMMGIELFGADNVIYFAVACFIAHYASGKRGIYTVK
ncbi:MAG: chloride channel protein [Chitinophagaceae bacterium]